MPSKKLIKGLPNNLIQQYFSTLFYYSDGYMSDWIWNTAIQKNHTQLTIDIINKTVRPADLQIKPIVAYLDILQETISKTLTSLGFDKDFIVDAKFDISISQRFKIHKLLTVEATIMDKDGRIYKSKKYEEEAYEKSFVAKMAPVDKPTLLDKIKNMFRQ
jgi:hypothetical protein